MLRRHILSFAALFPIAACSGLEGVLSGSTPVTLDQVRAYVSDLIGAVSAGAMVYLSGPPAPSAANAHLVLSIISDMQSLGVVVQNTTSATDAKSVILEIVTGVNSILPFVIPALGPVAPLIPLAIAVAQAFINALPLPTNAPPQPPTALHRMALKYHAGK